MSDMFLILQVQLWSDQTIPWVEAVQGLNHSGAPIAGLWFLAMGFGSPLKTCR